MKVVCFWWLMLPVHLLAQSFEPQVFFRINQYGYLPAESKRALIMSKVEEMGSIELIRLAEGNTVNIYDPVPLKAYNWGDSHQLFEVDFSEIQDTGKYILRTLDSGVVSSPFRIAAGLFNEGTDALLDFMRQQRCGYNPFLDMVCHQRDGRIFYGQWPDSTFVDASGGWHDAGDQLKYLITGSYATAHMLKAYEMFPDRFSDKVNALGQPFPNGLDDVLDEAKWGLEWILKLYFSPGQLIHQVGDDRDHIGWKMPDADRSDYGWGSNSYRVAYVANGKPQGLNRFKSVSTGMANLAGRSAAALAMGAQIWKELDDAFALKCAAAAKSIYQMGLDNEGFQQGNSYGAPYRYNEQTWADDMEWGAAELFRLTGDEKYLQDAKRYAVMAGTDNWLLQDSAAHYQYYPFINIGHFALYELVDASFQDTLAGYYREEIENVVRRAQTNNFGIGIPFIWCSNNLLTSFITEIILYEQMTGDHQFHEAMVKHWDWLWGMNPWGTSMFTGMPEGGEYPEDIHTSVWALTGKVVRGGLIDGPVYGSIYRNLIGLTLLEPDEMAAFQNPFVVYHDDIGDYSTNEPTMDGTAGSMIIMAYWSQEK